MAATDSLWLDVRAGLNSLVIDEYHRPYSVLLDDIHVTDAKPQLIVLIGDRTKTIALPALRFGTTFHSTGGIHLRTGTSLRASRSPVLFADCELHNAECFKGTTKEPSIDVTRRPLEWSSRHSPRLEPKTVAHLVYSKLLFPFASSVCLFADDLGGVTEVARTLVMWLTELSNRSSDAPAMARPAIIIVCREIEDEAKATSRFLEILCKQYIAARGKIRKQALHQLLSNVFSDIHVMRLPSVLDPQRRWREFAGKILDSADKLHTIQQEAGVAFTTKHFRVFFQMACSHFATDITSPFHFIRASRTYNPVPVDIAQHLSNLMRAVDHSPQIMQFVVPTIASALAFDNLPPGMHHFPPNLVFEALYRRVCESLNTFGGHEQPREVISSVYLANRIASTFHDYSLQVINGDISAAEHHRMILKKHSQDWTHIRSSKTCFSCVARRPENTLDCLHAFCDSCLIAHGKASEDDPWHLSLETCPLCSRSNAKGFKLKPYTAGVRCFSADGGGIRGIIMLPFLRRLLEDIDLPLSVHDHFDMAVGTSSGALIVLGLFFNNWSIDECDRQFQDLARLAFSKKLSLQVPFFPRGVLSRLSQLLCLTTDSLYRSSGINSALKSAYGSEETLFGSAGSKTKLAITATTTDDSSTCIFTNYNGPALRPGNSDYHIVRPDSVQEEMKTWEAARASSAAPSFFRSFMGFHDGGLGGHNNPISLALWEQDFVWSRRKKQPDVVLSLGTGYKSTDDNESREKAQTFIQSWFGPRLFRSFMILLCGEKKWRQVWNDIIPGHRQRYYRMNVEFHDHEPQLDDVDAMMPLRDHARRMAVENRLVRGCADALVASLFYLELDCVPVVTRTSWLCHGRILCRIPAKDPALHMLASRMIDQHAAFYFDQRQIPCVDESTATLVRNGERFSRAIQFEVTSLEDDVDVKVDGILKRPRSISSCPYKVCDLINDQGLNSVFGHHSHKRRCFFDFERSAKKPRRSK